MTTKRNLVMLLGALVFAGWSTAALAQQPRNSRSGQSLRVNPHRST